MNLPVLRTGNSARSILPEAPIGHYGAGRVSARSAGSCPVGRAPPEAFVLLNRNGIESAGRHPKSWGRFAEPDTPAMDAATAVCGNAASESCPIWPAAAACAHWGAKDPAAAQADWPPAFGNAHEILASRTRAPLNEPIGSLGRQGFGGLLARMGAVS